MNAFPFPTSLALLLCFAAALCRTSPAAELEAPANPPEALSIQLPLRESLKPSVGPAEVRAEKEQVGGRAVEIRTGLDDPTGCY